MNLLLGRVDCRYQPKRLLSALHAYSNSWLQLQAMLLQACANLSRVKVGFLSAALCACAWRQMMEAAPRKDPPLGVKSHNSKVQLSFKGGRERENQGFTAGSKVAS